MAHKSIGDFLAMIEEGMAGIKQLTQHEPSTSMDDEAGEYELEPTVKGRGRRKQSTFKLNKKSTEVKDDE